jgi:hypothetical protein
MLGYLLSSCTGGESKRDSRRSDNEEVEEVTPTPTEAAKNPLNVRGTASIPMQVESINNGFYEAIAYEVLPGQDISEANPIASVTKEKINHQRQLPTQWDFRMTIPNFSPSNTYYVFGAVYATPEKLTMLLEGKCTNNAETKLCSIVGEGNLVNYWMELLPSISN